MRISEIRAFAREKAFTEKLQELYGEKNDGLDRLYRLLDQFEALYGDTEAAVLSGGGRVEVGGNHTDHQGGCVLAAAISLDILAVARKNDDMIIRYAAKGYEMEPVDISGLEVRKELYGTSESLFRGVAAGMKKRGYKIGGFDMVADSRVLPGSGMSSSAAFEVMIGTAFNHFYNNGRVKDQVIAMVSQYAENVYFGKPSGLMDQMACACGGLIGIDFRDAEKPKITKADYDFEAAGYAVMLTDCRANHADLTDAYAGIPQEMKAAARVMGHELLSQCTMKELLEATPAIREQCGDRAWLRSFHYMNETGRAKKQVKALKKGDLEEFLNLVRESGRSSYEYLQNIYADWDVTHQSMAVGLALSDHVLQDGGAWRVHGGGFAGTILAFVPLKRVSTYRKTMEKAFGKDCTLRLKVRQDGGIRLI